MDNTKIIEINWVKMEIDLRQAKTIENYKVWDNVKILVQSYWDNYDSYIWQIIWFDDFTVNPTIVVAYLKVESSTATIEFAYINQKSQKYEITSLSFVDAVSYTHAGSCIFRTEGLNHPQGKHDHILSLLLWYSKHSHHCNTSLSSLSSSL